MGPEGIVPIVLCGGAGTRLWPASRESRPKQFLPLLGARSSFQETVLAVSDPALFGRPIVIANAEHRFLIADQLAEIGAEADIVLEPARRDSGPATLAASLIAQRRDPDAVVLTLAADHLVRKPEAFRNACVAALPAARDGAILVFGVTPEAPSTAYGYIRPGELSGHEGVRKVDAFVEKPDAATASRYVADGYLWNAGNFLFAARTLAEDYARFEPGSAEAVARAVAGAVEDMGFLRLDPEAFNAAVPKSVDYAVMERTSRAAVVPVDHGWSDLGTWDTVWKVSEKDANGNAVRGPVELLASENCMAMSDRLLVTVSGLKDVVVVADDDAVLVARRDDADGIRNLVGHLREKGRPQADNHARGFRPWGFYQSLDSGSRFQVKRIVVKPGARLSLQRHAHRAEHWVVVRGLAEVTVGEETKILHENESTYIPQGAIHRLCNPGTIELEVIEVQTGSYFGEDDIERFEDVYGR